MGATMKDIFRDEDHEITAVIFSQLLMDWKRHGDRRAKI
jgi:hypothetical protein